MIKTNLNRYVSRHLLILYILFIVTGVLFLWRYDYIIRAEPEIVVLTDTIPIYIDSAKTHDMFLHDIGEYESGNNYRIVNKFGYLGKYQFGKSTLKGLGIECTAQEFLTQPDLQEFAMDEYMRHNKRKLSEYIGKYQFTYRHGVFITESGILAAAHLGGSESVRLFFTNGSIFKDGSGIPVTTYMKMFSGYNLVFK